MLVFQGFFLFNGDFRNFFVDIKNRLSNNQNSRIDSVLPTHNPPNEVFDHLNCSSRRVVTIGLLKDSTVTRAVVRFELTLPVGNVQLVHRSLSLTTVAGVRSMSSKFALVPDFDEMDEGSIGDYDEFFDEEFDYSAEGVVPSHPTDAKPGSDDKVLMLAARYAAGLPLWHNSDRYDHGPGKAEDDEL
jgi:hypothetical protein